MYLHCSRDRGSQGAGNGLSCSKSRPFFADGFADRCTIWFQLGIPLASAGQIWQWEQTYKLLGWKARGDRETLSFKTLFITFISSCLGHVWLSSCFIFIHLPICSSYFIFHILWFRTGVQKYRMVQASFRCSSGLWGLLQHPRYFGWCIRRFSWCRAWCAEKGLWSLSSDLAKWIQPNPILESIFINLLALCFLFKMSFKMEFKTDFTAIFPLWFVRVGLGTLLYSRRYFPCSMQSRPFRSHGLWQRIRFKGWSSKQSFCYGPTIHSHETNIWNHSTQRKKWCLMPPGYKCFLQFAARLFIVSC